MRRILLATVIALLALTLSGAVFADEEKTVEKNIALAMTFTGDEAAIGDYIHATMLVNSLRALGGVIELDGDRLVLKLELGPEQLNALRKALAECESGEGMAGMFGPGMMGHGGAAIFAPGPELRVDENRKIIVMQKEDDEGCKCGSHERFLLGKKHEAPCDGCKTSTETMKKEMKVIVKADASKDKGITIREETCKLIVTCPHCGKPVEIDVPMPKMPVPSDEHAKTFMFRMHPDGEGFECLTPDMPMPPEEYFEKYLYRMHPEGEFAPPHPPMPDMDMMRERMGPMMEEMERMHRERGDMERRFGDMERALDEFHRQLGPRDEERDREFWRAIEELHRALDDRDRERAKQFDELWRALEGLFKELEELERELE